MFLVIPSSVYLIGFGNDLVRLIYERGAFDPAATTQTTQALYFYSFGLIGFAGVRVAAPVFYAMADSRRPMYYSVASVVINIGLNFAFIPLWGFAGLAAATSAAGLVNLGLLMYNMRHKIAEMDFSVIIIKAIKIIIAAVAAYFIVSSVNLELIIGTGSLKYKIAIVALQVAGLGGLYLIFAWLLRVNETRNIIGIITRKTKKGSR